MKAYWANLTERERWMLLGCGVFLVIYLIYALIYAPIKNGLAEKEMQLYAKQNLLIWMKDASKTYHSLKKVEILSASKLLTVLTTQLKRTSFKSFPYQLQQTSTGDIQLSFEKVPYNAFLNWIWDMHQRYAIHIKQLNIERTSTDGIVKISIHLTR